MEFIVIGITDRPEPFFPPDVLGIIRGGRVFSGGKRHHELVGNLLPADAQWIDITTPLDRVFEQYEVLGSKIIVFASGDPLFFGFANTILRRLPQARLTVYPAFNSLQLLAHRLLLPYHSMRIVSLTGRPWPQLDRALIERSPMVGVLTDSQHTPAAIARRLLDYGYQSYQMHVGEHLGHPLQERVSTLSLDEAARQEFTQPNCVILTLTEEPSESAPPFGLPDESFALLDGRQKMITKMPIRLLTLQALGLPRRRVLWDVGACTGSVSIEARLQFPHLHVVAFEVRPECEAIIQENVRRHGAPGIELHIGDFCTLDTQAIAAASGAPDAVFIGGHGGRLKDIMRQAVQVLAPGGVVVMNSVTSRVVEQATSHRPGSRQLFDEACRELGLTPGTPLHIQLDNHNPIEILSCSK